MSDRRRRPSIAPAFLAALTFVLPLAAGAPLAAAPESLEEYKALVEADIEASLAEAAAEPAPFAPEHRVACINGQAGAYPCLGIDLMEFMPVSTFGSTSTNSLWGWTDPQTDKEYALLGVSNGTAFIDITDPENPVYVGKLPTHTGSSSWRDVRTYLNYAYIVADNNGAHGMQVFDLTQLRNVPSPPVTFTETAHYNQVTNVHTISINQETARAVLVGSNTCSGGLHIVNISNPTAPAFAGCYDDGAYVHENQCFTYHGPDTTYTGHDICLASRGSAESIDIIDITNPAAPVRLDTFRYQPVGVSSYSHQAWFTEDHRYILLDDEFDESDNGHATRTWLFNATDLNNVGFAGSPGYHAHATNAIDHNLYVRGDHVFESNYRAGLRILRLTDMAQGQIDEVAFFDLDPASDAASFAANWNNYPFFESGNIIASHIGQGLFILQPTICLDPLTPPTGLGATPNGDHRIDLDWNLHPTGGAVYAVERALGGCGGTFEEIASDLASPAFSDLTVSGQVPYGYRVRAGLEGGCLSEPSACVEATTTGSCTAPPAFAGLDSATNGGESTCRVDLAWSAATPFCAGPASYSVHRSTTPDFVPSVANRIAQGVAGTSFEDFAAPSQTNVFYVVRATDESNGETESNLVHRGARATGPLGDGTFLTGAELGDPPLDTGDTLGGGSFAPETPEHAGWHISTTRAHTGARSFWSMDSDNMCVTLEGDVALTAGQSPQLTIRTIYDIEQGWDGGVVEVSTNGGGSWTRLTPAGGYGGTITNGGTLCGITQGSGAFTGTSPGFPAFQLKTFDLAPYDGSTIRLRWLYRTDGGVTGEGWYVDDISVSHAQVPGSCSNDVLLLADYEEGDFSEWTSSVP